MKLSLAIVALIFALSASSARPRAAAGEQMYITHAIQTTSSFNDCLDDHRLLFDLHSNQTLSLNNEVVPLPRLPAIIHQFQHSYTNPELWLRADPTVTVQEVAYVLDTIHSNAPSANIFLITRREMSDFLAPTDTFKYIGVTHPERLPHPPSICVFLKPTAAIR